jgi:hypothetical protein
MKVIVYQEAKKFTVNNISIPDIDKFKKMVQDGELSDMSLKDLQLYDFRITSTRGMLDDGELIHDEALEKEVEEGISWRNETVN